MFFVKNSTSSTLEVKKSKFISHLIPYSIFNKTLQKLKDEHPKARHFVYAFRYFNEFNQIIEGSSDDGEPRGTSGKPTLNVLVGSDLIESAIITVRYFGGIKLGTGGLVKAYSSSANFAISESNLIEYKKLETELFEIQYSEISKAEYLFEKNSLEIISKEFNIFGAIFKIKGVQENLEKIKKSLF